MILYLGTLWIALLVGIIVGWAWKPRWARQGTQKLNCVVSKSLELSLPPSPSKSPRSPSKSFGSAPCLKSLKIQSQTCEAWIINNGTRGKPPSVSPSENDNCRPMPSLWAAMLVLIFGDWIQFLWEFGVSWVLSSFGITIFFWNVSIGIMLRHYHFAGFFHVKLHEQGLFEEKEKQREKREKKEEERKGKSVKQENGPKWAMWPKYPQEDLKHLWQLVEMRDGGPSWIHMMDRSTPNMSYQAWRRDPKTGPPQYHSKTVFEDATSKMVRDFFWDDEFRPKWDDMLAYSATEEECPATGTMVVQWIRKFPFFCSDREYIIGRRIWELDGSYYCVTKGVSCPSIRRRNKPRRVDLYYSSWYIQAVESRRGNGQLTACEVLLFHHEDMGIPWEIAKLGIRQGMWGTVKKIEPGFRAYQKERASLVPLSRPASMAQINTKINSEYLRSLESNEDLSKSDIAATSKKPLAKNISRLLIFGGVIVLACSLDRGLLSKAFIFGVGRRLANRGKRLRECCET